MQVAQDTNHSTQNSTLSRRKLQTIQEDLENLAWKDDLSKNSELALKVREFSRVSSTQGNSEISIQYLPELERDIRDNVDIPNSFSLMSADHRMARDGGSESMIFKFYDKEAGEVLFLSTSVDRSISSNKPDGERINSSVFIGDAGRILNDYSTMRQISQSMLQLDSLDNIKIEKSLRNGATIFTFTNNENKESAAVEFDKNGSATVVENNFQKEKTQEPKIKSSEFAAAIIRHTSIETVIDLQQFAAKNEQGEYILSDERSDEIKLQLAKSFNFPQDHNLSIFTDKNSGSALLEHDGKKYIMGNVYKPNSEKKALFIYNTSDHSLLINGEEITERSKVQSRIEDILK